MQELELSEVYDGSEGDYELQSLVGFYGQHYFAFVRQADSSWLQFDDAMVCTLCSCLLPYHFEGRGLWWMHVQGQQNSCMVSQRAGQ